MTGKKHISFQIYGIPFGYIYIYLYIPPKISGIDVTFSPFFDVFSYFQNPSGLVPLGALRLEALEALGYPDDDQIDTTWGAETPIFRPTPLGIWLGWDGHLLPRSGLSIWMFPKIMGFPPKSSMFRGFSMIFTIHFGVPLLLETPIYHFLWTQNNQSFPHPAPSNKQLAQLANTIGRAQTLYQMGPEPPVNGRKKHVTRFFSPL